MATDLPVLGPSVRTVDPHRVARPSWVVAAVVAAWCLGGVTGAIVAPAVASAAPQICAQRDAAVHRVVDGDTWFDIAADVGVSIRSLLEVNGAEPDDAIHPGDELCLPAGATPTTSAPSDAAPASGTCNVSGQKYTVASGDSWFRIARRVSVEMGDLLAANEADVGTTLQPGDQLCLPKGAELAADANAVVALSALPVQGPCWYGNTWRAPRGGGRSHEGVDLIAAAGSYVYAVADGVLSRRAWDQPGSRSGNAWWLTTADGTYFFYAHLSDFAPGMKAGSRVRAGQIIGFVGSTGNSATAHLHFEVHPHGGDAINPYPTVKAAGGCKAGTGYEQPGGWLPET